MKKSYSLPPINIGDLFHFSFKLVKLYTKKRRFVSKSQKWHCHQFLLTIFNQNEQKTADLLLSLYKGPQSSQIGQIQFRQVIITLIYKLIALFNQVFSCWFKEYLNFSYSTKILNFSTIFLFKGISISSIKHFPLAAIKDSLVKHFSLLI